MKLLMMIVIGLVIVSLYGLMFISSSDSAMMVVVFVLIALAVIAISYLSNSPNKK